MRRAVADLLKKARLEAGLTQVEAAKRLRRPQSFISKCESGERRVDLSELKSFADAYGVAINYFLAELDAGAPPAKRKN